MAASLEERQIREARSAIDALADAERDAQACVTSPNDSELRQLVRRLRLAQHGAWEHLHTLQEIERDTFAASRGWRVYKGSQGHIFTDQLIAGSMTYGGYGYPRDVDGSTRIIDHRECFVRCPPGKTSHQSCRYPVAILSHTYGDWEPCVEFARNHNLSVERLPYSWYYPGQCIAALFITKAELTL
jgi:hypothetical protein